VFDDDGSGHELPGKWPLYPGMKRTALVQRQRFGHLLHVAALEDRIVRVSRRW
jgi:hypothetical protein